MNKEEDKNTDFEEYEDPSFKDELRSIGRFFKNLFNRNEEDSEVLEDTVVENVTKTTEVNESLINSNSSDESIDTSSIIEESDGIEGNSDIRTNDSNSSTSLEDLKDNIEENKIQNVEGTKQPFVPVDQTETQDNKTSRLPKKKRFKKFFKARKRKELTEEQIRYKKVKLYKNLTSTFLFLGIFFSVSIIGFKSTSDNRFCTSCHEMKPEGYTMHASSHSDVACVDCHTQPGLKAMFQEKVSTFNMFAKKITNKSDIPITIKNDIPDETCMKCHDMSKRQATHSGDWIIPHVKHQQNNVACVDCHSGVAHGKIAERALTKRGDLANWSQVAGERIMQDRSFIDLNMDDCMTCHEARDITRDCNACHTTGMVPESHKDPSFKYQTHGSQAIQDIRVCDNCHKYMAAKEIKLAKDDKKTDASKKDLKSKTLIVSSYTVDNDFCRKCHEKRPPSHTENFFSKHAGIASKNKTKCFGCHSEGKLVSKNAISKAVACGKCHPSLHEKNDSFNHNHPGFQLTRQTKIEPSCFEKCHVNKKCAECHYDVKI